MMIVLIIRSRRQLVFGVGEIWIQIPYSTTRNFTNWARWKPLNLKDIDMWLCIVRDHFFLICENWHYYEIKLSNAKTHVRVFIHAIQDSIFLRNYYVWSGKSSLALTCPRSHKLVRGGKTPPSGHKNFSWFSNLISNFMTKLDEMLTL